MRIELHRFFQLLFSRYANISTPEERSQKRYRRAALTTIVMIVARVTNILTGLLTVPITLKYLGEDLFGIWMVLTSVVGFLSFYDFGIGVGLRNMLIECMGKDNVDLPRKLIGNALLVLTTLASLLIILVFIGFPHIPWGELIKCKNPTSIPQILPTAQAVVFMFAIGLPITQLQNIASAYQRGYWGYLCFLIGRILGFLFVVWCVMTAKPLWLLAGGYVGIPFLITLIGWFVFLTVAPSLRPWPVRPEQALIKRLFGIGFFVLIHHIGYAMVNTSAIIIIANTINAASAIPYSVTQKLLGVSSVLTASIMLGISVAVGEAWHRQDYAWIHKTLRRTEKIVWFCGILPLIILLFAGQLIILWWTRSPEAVPSFLLLLACVLLSAALTVGSIYSNCLMAMNHVRFTAITTLIAGCFVIIGGYLIGTVFKSPEMIASLQFFIGTFIPAILFWRRMRQLLKMGEVNQGGTFNLSKITVGQSAAISNCENTF